MHNTLSKLLFCVFIVTCIIPLSGCFYPTSVYQSYPSISTDSSSLANTNILYQQPFPTQLPPPQLYTDPYAKPVKNTSKSAQRRNDTRYVHPYTALQMGNYFYCAIPTAYLPNWRPTPVDALANAKSLKRKQNDTQFLQAYNIALQITAPLAGLPREQQLVGIAQGLRSIFGAQGTYSTSVPQYNTPYGYLVNRIASCAGCARATGLCLNILGIPYEHVNENKWLHQWCRVRLDNGAFWISDAFGLYVGPEHSPYRHPAFPDD